MSPERKKYFQQAIKVALFIVLFWAIYAQIFANQNLEEIREEMQQSLRSTSLLWFLCAVIFVAFNWSLEALKWQMLMRRIEQIGMFKSLQAILAGLTLAVFTPNRIGEYGGRILFVTEGNRMKSIAVCVVGSLSQTVVTLVSGLIALPFFLSDFDPVSYVPNGVYMVVCLLLVAVALFLFFNLKLLYNLLRSISILRRYLKYVAVLRDYKRSTLLKVLGFSTTRYVVFSLQYWFLMNVFGLDLSFSIACTIIPIIFLVQTIVPSIAVAELGIRGNVALYLLTPFAENAIGIIAATFSLWLINLIIPAVIGFFITLKTDFYTNKR